MPLSTASPHLGERSRLYDPEMFRVKQVHCNVGTIGWSGGGS